MLAFVFILVYYIIVTTVVARGTIIVSFKCLTVINIYMCAFVLLMLLDQCSRL